MANSPSGDSVLDRLVRHYFGDTRPGAATARFVKASTDLIEARVERAMNQA